jgi:hypothetical protein
MSKILMKKKSKRNARTVEINLDNEGLAQPACSDSDIIRNSK